MTPRMFRLPVVCRSATMVLLFCAAVQAQAAAAAPREATPEQTAEQLRAALTNLDQWLSTSSGGAGWHEYLRTKDLRAQLDRGLQADPQVVWAILAEYVSDAPGLDLAPFWRVRRAIERWLASLPPPSMEKLSQELQLAKAAFIPRTQDDLHAAKKELLSRVRQLDSRLTADKAGGQAWRDFLLWKQMQSELAKEKPDLRQLDAVFAQYSSGYEGLQMNWFADVRDALRTYLLTARTIGNKDLKARCVTVLDDLAARAKKYRSQPTAEEARAINADLQLWRDAGQPERVLRAVQANLSYANLYLRASAWLAGVGIAGPVSQTGPVTDNILGTAVYGDTQTTGQTTTELAPSSDLAQIDIIFQGRVLSNNVGYNGPVQIYSNSYTDIASRKRLLMDAEHAWSLPATSQATNRSDVNGIQASSRIAQRVASRRVGEQQGQAEAIAAEHAQERANQQVDQRGETELARLNAQFAERIRDPLLLYNAFPRFANLSTTADALHLTALQGRLTDLASPWAPPEPEKRWDLLVQVHESAINNAANQVYAGAVVKQESFLASVEKLLGKVPERFRDDDPSQNWSVALAERDPFSVSFQDGVIRLTLRGEEYTTRDNQYPAMNVSVAYRPESTPQGVAFVRQGAVEIFPPDFQPEKGQKLSPREQALRSMLERRFNRMFEPRFQPDPLVFSGNWKKAGELRLTQANCWAGWLVLGWQPIPAGEKKPAAKPATPAPAAKPAPAPAKPAPAATQPPAAKHAKKPAAKDAAKPAAKDAAKPAAATP